jgi:mycofactocin biosynthetic radical S-adenosylmethionine protein MftC
VPVSRSGAPALRDDLERGLAAPICLTWELTYACNLACRHCLSSSGRRDPAELTPAEARGVVDQLAAMQVFYVNVGGGEPMLRADFFDLLGYAVESGVGVKFSTNGTRLTRARAVQLAGLDYVDVQVSVDGATAEANDAVRGKGSFAAATAAMGHLADAGFGRFKVSVVVTRQNVAQLDALAELADRYGAQLRLTRLRPSGRGADTWDELHPTAEQQRDLYRWLFDRPDVLTGDSFFHLSALGEPLDGLNLCGAGRVVCLIDPVGDVYACPFVIHPDFLAGNVREPGGFRHVWGHSSLFAELREPQSAGACASCGSYDACRGGCMAAKFFTGLPLAGPDPECVFGHGEAALAASASTAIPRPAADHSRAARRGTPVRLAPPTRRPVHV